MTKGSTLIVQEDYSTLESGLHTPAKPPLPRPIQPHKAAPATFLSDIIHRIGPRVYLLFLIGVWFASGIGSTLLAKMLLSPPYSIREGPLTLYQLIFSTLSGASILHWFKLHPKQQLSRSQFKQVLALSSCFLLKNLLAFISMSRVPVSFLNTIRASAPIFTVILSSIFLGQTVSRETFFSLLPITFGVTLASVAEFSSISSSEMRQSVVGLGAAFLTTLVTVTQNIFSKVLFDQQELDSVNLQYYLSICAFFYLAPWHLVMDMDWTWGSSEASGSVAPDPLADAAHHTMVILILANGLCSFAQSQVALHVLSHVTPLTYTVTSTMKRVAIIVISIMFFGNRVTMLNAMGIMLSISGVAWYNIIKVKKRSSRSHAPEPVAPKTLMDVAAKRRLHLKRGESDVFDV